MKKRILTAITVALAVGAPLAAQEPHYGLGVIVGVPTAALNSTLYPDGSTETYNTGLGVQFTISWPVDRSLAFRLNVGGITFDGSGNAGPNSWNVEDSLVNIGGDAQIFLADGNALRHTGTYLIGGLSLDLERFSASDFNYGYYPNAVVNKTRLAANAGIGHTFRYSGRYRWTLEAVYHKTLTGTNSNDDIGVGTPSSDFVKLYAGIEF